MLEILPIPTKNRHEKADFAAPKSASLSRRLRKTSSPYFFELLRLALRLPRDAFAFPFEAGGLGEAGRFGAVFSWMTCRT